MIVVNAVRGTCVASLAPVDAERDEYVWAQQKRAGANLLEIDDQITRAAAEEIGDVLVSEGDASSITDDADALTVSAHVGVVAHPR